MKSFQVPELTFILRRPHSVVVMADESALFLFSCAFFPYARKTSCSYFEDAKTLTKLYFFCLENCVQAHTRTHVHTRAHTHCPMLILPITIFKCLNWPSCEVCTHLQIFTGTSPLVRFWPSNLNLRQILWNLTFRLMVPEWVGIA